MMLEYATKEAYGYCPKDLKRKSHKPIIAACELCGEFKLIKRSNYSTFCRSCSHIGTLLEEARRRKSTRSKGKGNPNWRGGKVKCICKECGKTFYRDKNVVLNGNAIYCSHSCVAIATISHNHFPTHHTKPERIFKGICLRNSLPFRYVGDGQLWIGKKGGKQLNPDFIEANGKKIVVEIFGDYWHSPLLNRNMKEGGTLDYRMSHYKRYKWQPIFIWETDLLRSDAEAFVLHKLKQLK